jgi:hypothetical protein
MQSRRVGTYRELCFRGRSLQQSVCHGTSHDVSKANEDERGSVGGNQSIGDWVHSDCVEQARPRIESAGARAKEDDNASFPKYALGDYFLQRRFEERFKLGG